LWAKDIKNTTLKNSMTDNESKLDRLFGENPDEMRRDVLDELKEKERKARKLREARKFRFKYTPRELFQELTKFVIGQEEPMQRVCNAVCYHYQSLEEKRKGKNNVLMMGPTGCGKTYVIEKISDLLKVPLVLEDATKYSGAGYVGDKVENIIQDLVIKAGGDLNSASRGIVYLDEIDKIAAADMMGRDVSGRDVQNGLLKIVESSDVPVMTNEGKRMLNTKNILFIGGGAFSDLYKILKQDAPAKMGFVSSKEEKEPDYGEVLQRAEPHELIAALQKYGMIPELLGRLPVIARFKALGKEELVRILKESADSPIIFYKKDFAAYGIDTQFTEDAYQTIAEMAHERGMGARGLRSVIEESLTPFKFYLPDLGINEITFSSKYIKNPQESLRELLEKKETKLRGGKNGKTK
jgi:ATP-dependent Clp protease ATP-binding subunit ClpX